MSPMPSWNIFLREACKDARLVGWRAEEAGVRVQWPMQIGVDNNAGVSFQNATCVNTRLRGVFDFRNKWVREVRDQASVKAIPIDTKENIADALTKSISGTTLRTLSLIVDKIA